MTGLGSTALLVFEDHLARIQTGIRFVEVALSAKKSANRAIDWRADAHAVGAVRTFIGVEAYPEDLLCNANYLSSVAAFEEFLRQTLDTAILASVAKLRSFDDMDPGLQDMHMKATGRLLARRANPPQQLSGLDYFELCRRIGTCLPGSTTFEFNSQALCLLDDALSVDQYLETLRKFGYSASWDTLGAKEELRACFGTTGTRETRKALERFLADMVRQRNRIAHTGTSASEVSSEVLLEHLRVLGATARALAASLS